MLWELLQIAYSTRFEFCSYAICIEQNDRNETQKEETVFFYNK